MAFRRNFRGNSRRSFRRGPRPGLIWATFIETDFYTGPGAQGRVITEPGDWGITAGNQKVAGTLMRIRGRFEMIQAANFGALTNFSWHWGMTLSEFDEGIQNVNTSGYGLDEDVLYWDAAMVRASNALSSNASDATIRREIDIRAKRRMNIEDQIRWTMEPSAVISANSFIYVLQVRCLIKLPVGR